MTVRAGSVCCDIYEIFVEESAPWYFQSELIYSVNFCMAESCFGQRRGRIHFCPCIFGGYGILPYGQGGYGILPYGQGGYGIRPYAGDFNDSVNMVWHNDKFRQLKCGGGCPNFILPF